LPTGDSYDVVVAGAGHNSLIAAAYLAKAGLRCLILEGRSVIGGDTATEELTLPGFLHDSCSTAHNLLQASPTLRDNELGLDRYGLEYIRPDPVLHVPFPDGTSITMWRDLEATAAELARFSTADAASYRRMMAEYDDVKGAFGAARYTRSISGNPSSASLRPAPGWAQHRMPIPGLYQTGSTTHPGASVSGAPGRNAAWVMLSDLGFDFEEVARRA
jgi:phytoene dehydrogenase-like protein